MADSGAVVGRGVGTVVAVLVLVGVPLFVGAGVSSLAAGEGEVERPGMALAMQAEGDVVTVEAVDGDRVAVDDLVLAVRWSDGSARVPFAAGVLASADGDLAPGDEWSWDGGCSLPAAGSSVTLRVVHEPSGAVVAAAERPVEPGSGATECGS